MRRVSLIAASLLAVAFSLSLTAGQTPAGVFTAQQAAAGRAAYQASCASCHLPDLRGRNEASPLAGPELPERVARQDHP